MFWYKEYERISNIDFCFPQTLDGSNQVFCNQFSKTYVPE